MAGVQVVYVWDALEDVGSIYEVDKPQENVDYVREAAVMAATGVSSNYFNELFVVLADAGFYAQFAELCYLCKHCAVQSLFRCLL